MASTTIKGIKGVTYSVTSNSLITIAIYDESGIEIGRYTKKENEPYIVFIAGFKNTVTSSGDIFNITVLN